MKKSIKKLLQIAAVIIGGLILFLNVSINGKSNANNANLSALTKLSEANAECVSHGWAFDLGECNEGYEICYYVGLGGSCDPAY